MQLLSEVFHGKKKALPASMKKKAIFRVYVTLFYLAYSSLEESQIAPYFSALHTVRYEITISALYVIGLLYDIWDLGHEQSNIGIILYSWHYFLHYFYYHLFKEAFIFLLARPWSKLLTILIISPRLYISLNTV